MRKKKNRNKDIPSTSTAGVTHCTTPPPPPPPATAGTTTASDTIAKSKLVRVTNLQAVMVSSPVPVMLTTVPPERGPWWGCSPSICGREGVMPVMVVVRVDEEIKPLLLMPLLAGIVVVVVAVVVGAVMVSG